MKHIGVSASAVALGVAVICSCPASVFADSVNNFEIQAAEGRRVADDNVPYNPATGKGTVCISSAVCPFGSDASRGDAGQVPFNPAIGAGTGCVSSAVCDQ